MHTRRRLLQAASTTVAASMAAASLAVPGRAAAGQSLGFVKMGYTLAIHVPAVTAMQEILPSMPGYLPSRVNAIEQIQTITQSLIAGASDFGDSDFVSTIKAVQSGADLVVIGNAYVNTSLVLVVNADKVHDVPDLLKPDVQIAVNGTADGTFVSWAGALVQASLDPRKLHTVALGGSGSRMRAMLSKRIDGTPVHFDQAEALKKAGNFAVLVQPWKVFHPWMNEVWVTSNRSLADPQKRRMAVDVLKATVIAFRKASTDLAWYAERYRRYATIPGARTATDAQISPVWETLRGPVGAWPSDMNFSVENAQRLLPSCIATGAVSGTVDFNKFMRTDLLHQALTELG